MKRTLKPFDKIGLYTHIIYSFINQWVGTSNMSYLGSKKVLIEFHYLIFYIRWGFFQKNWTDKIKKHTTYALERPEPKSKEFDSLTCNTKALADLKVLNIKAFEISAMDAIVRHIKTDRKFWCKNNGEHYIANLE